MYSNKVRNFLRSPMGGIIEQGLKYPNKTNNNWWKSTPNKKKIMIYTSAGIISFLIYQKEY